MAQLTGITNVNEFYSHHYLDAILTEDLKGVAKAWKEQAEANEEKTPPERLSALAKTYFRTLNQWEGEKEDSDRLLLQQQWLGSFLEVLGYSVVPQLKLLEEEQILPIIGEVKKDNGSPLLWVIEALPPQESKINVGVLEAEAEQKEDKANDKEESLDLLDLSLHPCQFDPPCPSLTQLSLENLISEEIFALDEPPRWIILLNLYQVVLIDRFKWNSSRFLRFDLGEILGRKETETLLAIATLLHREHTCPSQGTVLLDQLDENSHRHAFAVSDDLKYALRESIELLGNEAVWYLQNKRKEGVFKGKLDANQLTVECLRYMYRLLF